MLKNIKSINAILSIIIIAVSIRGLLSEEVAQPRVFEVDYENDRFLMDNETFRYISGEIHYFRIPSEYWQDRLHKMKAAGLNTVSTYIEWSSHEPSPTEFKFDGDQDIVKFIKIAQNEGLYVILRPGPYICAEREFGGFPSWLLTINPNMKLRTSDPSYTYFVARWFRHLMPRIKPLLYGNGGPVIMLQVENEYGSYPVNDPNYLIWLRDLFRSHVEDKAVLFTTDGSGTSYLAGGRIPNVFTTVDFGAGGNIEKSFAPLRHVQPKGPLVNSEFYVGWLSYWGQPFATVSTNGILLTLEQMLKNKNVSFNMYMFHGGTNFGFSAGSGSDNHFLADLTSYDYDAPISEAGDLTDKYFAIKNLICKHFNCTENIPSQENKGNYGNITMQPVISLFKSPVGTESVSSEYPVSFEDLGQSYGFVAYESRLLNPDKDPSVLQVTVRDRAIVYLDHEEVSVLQYTVINETPLPPTFQQGQHLTLLIENMGRRNFQLLSDCTKGLITNATIDGVTIKDWNITGYPLTSADIEKVENLKVNATDLVKPPAFYKGQFQLPDDMNTPLDSYLDMSQWGKGVVFINEYNLGRYWHIGPQVTLYVPGCYLRKFPAQNVITILELHYTRPDLSINFVTEPYLNKTISSEILAKQVF